jgi:hypothetical protein
MDAAEVGIATRCVRRAESLGLTRFDVAGANSVLCQGQGVGHSVLIGHGHRGARSNGDALRRECKVLDVDG